MNLDDLINKYPIHDSHLENVNYNKEKKILNIEIKFSKEYIEFCGVDDFKLKGLKLTFLDVNKVLSHCELEKIVKEDNDVLSIFVKQRKNSKRAQVLFNLDHFEKFDPNQKTVNWFFIDFNCNNCVIEEML